jgi:hypothetical protein
MKIHRILACLSLAPCLSLGACSTISSESITSNIPLNDIVDRIGCDLKTAYLIYRKDYKWLDDWAASFTITIRQEDRSGVAPGLNYLLPTGANTSFGLGVSGGISGNNTRTLTTKRTIVLKNLKKFDCKTPNSSSALASELYLFEPLRDALRAVDKNDPANEKPDDLGYRIDFAVKTNISANPSFVLYRVPGIGAEFSVSREKTQSIDIAFSDNTPRGTPIVYVENLPPLSVSHHEKSVVSRQRGRVSTTPKAPLSVTPEARQRLDNTLQRLQLETLLPRRL